MVLLALFALRLAKQSEKITVASSNRFATQTLQIFVPLAHRLGMWYFKTELEQRCFAIASPREFAALSAQLEEVQKAHASTLYSTAQRLREALLADPVLAQHADWVRVTRLGGEVAEYVDVAAGSLGLSSSGAMRGHVQGDLDVSSAAASLLRRTLAPG